MCHWTGTPAGDAFPERNGDSVAEAPTGNYIEPTPPANANFASGRSCSAHAGPTLKAVLKPYVLFFLVNKLIELFLSSHLVFVNQCIWLH